jgi:hypothetical protein
MSPPFYRNPLRKHNPDISATIVCRPSSVHLTSALLRAALNHHKDTTHEPGGFTMAQRSDQTRALLPTPSFPDNFRMLAQLGTAILSHNHVTVQTILE